MKEKAIALICLISVITGCRSLGEIKPWEGKRIAVLPFENLTQDPIAGEKVRRIVMAELLKRNMEVIEPGEVTRILNELQIWDVSIISEEDIKKLGKELNAYLLIAGSVSAYGIKRTTELSYPEVTVHITFISPEDARIIGSQWSTEGGPTFFMSFFGTEGPTVNERAKTLVRNMINKLLSKEDLWKRGQ